MIDPILKSQAKGQTMGQGLSNEVLYISVAQILLEIQEVLQKYQFFKSWVVVKKC